MKTRDEGFMTTVAPRQLLAAAPGLLLASAFLACDRPPPPSAARSDLTEPTSANTTSSTTPTLQELAGATFSGIYDEPVTLTAGQYEGEPFLEGGASRPRVGLAEDFRLTGDLDQDGREETVVMLWENSGGSGTIGYLAVMGQREGEIVNLGTAVIGDRVGIRSARIVEQKIELEVVQAGPEDAACCPGEKATAVWALSPEGLTDVSSTVTGRLSLADLAGPEWQLTHLGREEPVPAEPEITLIFEGDGIAGGSGCNRYFADVEPGATPGSMTMGVIGATRMACPEAVMELELRYLEALGGVTRFSFQAGKLALTSGSEGTSTQLLFVDRELADSPPPP